MLVKLNFSSVTEHVLLCLHDLSSGLTSRFFEAAVVEVHVNLP